MKQDYSNIESRIKGLEIKSLADSFGNYAGAYHSAFKGSGISFSDLREYTDGDDFRYVEKNVSARMNKPYVKIFNEEREIELNIIFDNSKSMFFGSNLKYKYDTALELTAALVFSAAKNRDRTGCIYMSGSEVKYLPAKHSKSYAVRLLANLIEQENIDPLNNKKADLNELLSFSNKNIKKRSIVIIISDFIDFQSEQELSELKQKHDLILFRISDTFETNLANIGLANISGLSGNNVSIDMNNIKYQSDYVKEVQNEFRILEKICEMRSIDLIDINETSEIITALYELFTKRAKRH